MVADRIAFLDQMTRGRCVFGWGLELCYETPT